MFRQVQRRHPTQKRGKRRVEAILVAAAEVFAEEGFDGATMDDIATRADSSVGSIYQFFDNKPALFAAVADRSFAGTGELFDGLLTEDLLSSGWRAVIETFLDRFLQFERSDVFVRATYANLHMYGAFEATDRAMSEELRRRTTEVLGLLAGHLSAAKRKRIAATTVNITTAFLFFSRLESPREARRLLEETKLALVRYLEPYIEPAPTPARDPRTRR